MANQKRIAMWVNNTKSYAPEFCNPFVPSAQGHTTVSSPPLYGQNHRDGSQSHTSHTSTTYRGESRRSRELHSSHSSRLATLYANSSGGPRPIHPPNIPPSHSPSWSFPGPQPNTATPTKPPSLIPPLLIFTPDFPPLLNVSAHIRPNPCPRTRSSVPVPRASTPGLIPDHPPERDESQIHHPSPSSLHLRPATPVPAPTPLLRHVLVGIDSGEGTGGGSGDHSRRKFRSHGHGDRSRR